jgi:hypothetical protein
MPLRDRRRTTVTGDSRRLGALRRRPPRAAPRLPARAENRAEYDTGGQCGERRQMRFLFHPFMRGFRGMAGPAGGIVAGIDGVIRHMARLGQFALRRVVRDIDQMIGRPVSAAHGLFGVGEIDIHDKLHLQKETFNGSTDGRAKAFLVYCDGWNFKGGTLKDSR